jgi:hypothetical protein
MAMLIIIGAALLAATAVDYRRPEKPPSHGAYFGLAKFTGSPLDIDPVDWAT